MNWIRITKEFRFEMAHALWNYDGLCRNLHGHSYILRVTVKGQPIADSNHPKFGMVMDFGDLKAIVKDPRPVGSCHRHQQLFQYRKHTSVTTSGRSVGGYELSTHMRKHAHRFCPTHCPTLASKCATT